MSVQVGGWTWWLCCLTSKTTKEHHLPKLGALMQYVQYSTHTNAAW